MSRSAHVVIGANFGDEGKGLLTDYFARKGGIVVRFNGGAQAGHTVQLEDGLRHVFHHFGAGSLQGSSTHLSRFFISNPLLFLKEHFDLQGIGASTLVTADPRGLVTTPYDMMLNQMVEESRGMARHGSCGIGINETIKRHEAGLKLHVADLLTISALTLRLDQIRREWVPRRAGELGIAITSQWQKRIESDDILIKFVEACGRFDVAHVEDRLFKDSDGPIVFEGAQGLLLDEDHRFFPYVTHSHTGLRNVVGIAEEADIETLNVTYVTRAYVTRHGAGPFPNETPAVSYPDPTNIPNEWQGSLRFGILDLDLLSESIHSDLAVAEESSVKVNAGIAVTCLDQLESVSFVADGKLSRSDHPGFLSEVERRTGLKVTHTSHGPTRFDVLSAS